MQKYVTFAKNYFPKSLLEIKITVKLETAGILLVNTEGRRIAYVNQDLMYPEKLL